MQPGEFTLLLRQCSCGDKQALDAVTSMVYAELRRLAIACMRNERPGITLQPTALIHEAYLQLMRQDLPDFQSRAHFCAVASHIMRQLLISNARRFRAQKRGGGQRAALDEEIAIPAQQAEELLAVDESLEQLARRDQRAAKAVELKYFGGLSQAELSEAMGLSLATVKRDLAFGEAWLRRALTNRPRGKAEWPG